MPLRLTAKSCKAVRTSHNIVLTSKATENKGVQYNVYSGTETKI